MKRTILSVWLSVVVGAVAVGTVLSAQQPPAAPLLQELNAIAQRQLKDRATAIAAIHDRAAADARKADVRRRILSLIGGLPEYHGPLNARVTKTVPR